MFGSINLLVWNCFPIIYEFMCVGVYVFARIVHDVFVGRKISIDLCLHLILLVGWLVCLLSAKKSL